MLTLKPNPPDQPAVVCPVKNGATASNAAVYQHRMTVWRSASADLPSMQSHPVAVLWREHGSPAKLHRPRHSDAYSLLESSVHPRLVSVIAWAPTLEGRWQGRGVCQTGGRGPIATLSANQQSAADRYVGVVDASDGALMLDSCCADSASACMSEGRCKCKPNTWPLRCTVLVQGSLAVLRSDKYSCVIL